MLLRFGGIGSVASDEARTQTWRSPDGGVWATTVDAGGEVRIEFPSFGVATLSRSSGEVTGYPDEGIDPETFRVRIEKEAYPVLYQAIGLVSLHASAVAIGDRVIALVGPTHAGKSTLAHAWCRLDPRARIVADDAVVVDPAKDFSVRELPFVPSLRSATRARFGVPEDAVLERVTGRTDGVSRLVGALLLYPTSAAPTVDSIPAADAVLRLLPDAYCFLLSEADAARQFYESMLDLVSRLPIRRLAYPHDFAALEATVARIADATARWI